MQELEIPATNHFAQEMDHFARCIGTRPHTPDEEGLQDLRIIQAP